MNRARIGCWMILVVVGLGAGGCDENGPNLYQPGGEGRIEGTVRRGGVPLEVSVRATRVPDAPGDASRYEASVGADGSYAMNVPAGRYVVGLLLESNYSVTYEYSADGLRFGDAPPDTLRVDSQHPQVSVNFELAGLRAHLELSPLLDGEYGYVQLHRRGPHSTNQWRSYVSGAGGAIQNGTLDLAVGGVLPGTYRVEAIVGRRVLLCNCPYDGEHFWIPGVRDSAESPWIEVRADSTSEVTARLGTEPARVQGRIGGAWLDFGIDPPSLSFFAPDSSVVRGQRPVGNDGSFDERLYIPGPAKLLVSHQGIDQWIGGEHFAAATLFALEPGSTISGIEFVQSGIFLELALPYSRIEWTRFNLFDVATSSLAASWFVDYGSDLFGIPNLRPGTYRMHIETEFRGRLAWAPQWYDRASDQAQARTITIGQPGDIARVPVVLQKGGSIAGVVREAAGITATSYVYITRAGERTRWGYTFAFDGRRTFLVEGLPDGDWKIGAWRQDGTYPEQPPADTVWYPGTTDWEAAEVITTQGFEDITGIEIVMPVP